MDSKDLSLYMRRTLHDRYLLLEFLEWDGYSAFYEALDKQSNRSVTVKLGAGTIESESAILSAIKHHPNIVEVLDVGRDQDDFYLVYPRLDGVSLNTLISKCGTRSIKFVSNLVREIGGAIAYLQEHKIVHRDLKPRNIRFRDGNGNNFILLNFEIAAKWDSTGVDRNSGQDGAGTIEYMAPEFLMATISIVSEASDIYSFGAVLYESLTGRVPFQLGGATFMDMATCTKAIREQAPLPFRKVNPQCDCPAHIEKVVQQCLDKDPVRRPSIDAIQRAFLEI